MSIDALRSEIDLLLENSSTTWDVGTAVITDFLRCLHEVMTKAERDQGELLAQVQTVLGSSPTRHLARVIERRPLNISSYRTPEECLLGRSVDRICRQRGLETGDGRHLLSSFLRALDEARFSDPEKIESAAVMVFFSLGDEAAYHLGGLFDGDLGNETAVGLIYLDSRMRRFRKLVEIWEQELAWDKEERPTA